MPQSFWPSSGCLFQSGRSQRFDLLGKFSGNLSKTHAFGRRDPFQAQSCRLNAEYIYQLLCHFEHYFSLYITIQVMAFAHMSSGHQYPVGPLLKRSEDEIGVHPT